MSSIIVPASGPSPCDVLLVGKSPGKAESISLIPFTGRNGQELEWYLNRHGASFRHWRKTNVLLEFTDDSDSDYSEPLLDDSDDLILVSEVFSCQPKIIVTSGQLAARWFLGSEATLEIVHGLPHRVGAFDPSLSYRAPTDCIILPCYQPAMGFKDVDARSLINYDYEQVATVLNRVKRGEPINIREDEFEGIEVYKDITGQELADNLLFEETRLGFAPWIGLDTEGSPESPWSIQISNSPGAGYVLRVEQPDFQVGIRALQSYVLKPNVSVVIHNAMFDLEMCRAMGLDLSDATIFDTMYAAYLTRIDAYQTGEGSRRRRSKQGLKPLAWRWCGMRMKSHDETVGILGIERQVDYLTQVASGNWLAPETTIKVSNDGTAKPYKPQPIQRTAAGIIRDIQSGKVNKQGETTDPWERWKKIDKKLRKQVELDLGEMPSGSMRALAEVDFDAAIHYAARDSDAALRLAYKLAPELQRRGLM